MDTKCKNCGADEGLHHFETMQCPVGGYEAPVGRKQRWAATTYATDDRTPKEKAAPLLYEACKEIFNWPGLLRWGNECRFCQVKDDLQFPEKHDPKCPGRILAAAIAAAEKGE